ncbi:MAG: hypothetical protein HFH92_18710 [Lachnospiraceae bacterium]|nr:hypothetical protein [uncultured Acetatifactor sp.]MCI8791084.1 hypothetical protein [Lachnospiraceae bacterium]
MIYYLGYGSYCEIDRGRLPLLHNNFCKCLNYFEETLMTSEINVNELSNIQIVDRVINLPIQKYIFSKVILHANVIDVDGKYIAFIGDSCIGKTLLTIKCVARTNNVKFVTDDITFINEEGIVIPCCCRPLLVRFKNEIRYVRTTDIFNEANISHNSKKLACIVYLYNGSENRSMIELIIKSTWNVTAKNLNILMKIPFTTSPIIINDLERTIFILKNNLVGLGVI